MTTYYPAHFPLAPGAAVRMGRLRAYGNAINEEVARTFIESYIETKNPIIENNPRKD